MKPVITDTTNSVLKAPSGHPEVIDLPITKFKFDNGTSGVESCWELSEEELKKVKETGKIYFVCAGATHPPIMLSSEAMVEVK